MILGRLEKDPASTSNLPPMEQCAKCSYASRSFESLLEHVEKEHGVKED